MQMVDKAVHWENNMIQELQKFKIVCDVCKVVKNVSIWKKHADGATYSFTYDILPKGWNIIKVPLQNWASLMKEQHLCPSCNKARKD